MLYNEINILLLFYHHHYKVSNMIFTQLGSHNIQGIECPVMTWSETMKEYLQILEEKRQLLEEPKLVEYDKKYTKSYSVEYNFNFDFDIHILNSFHNIYTDNKIFLFKDLISQTIKYETLHYFFSYLHVISGDYYKNKTYSLYAPLGTTSTEGIEFPPHFDLYKQKMLFIIYNDVSVEGEAAITFLSKENFKKILIKEHIKNKEIILDTLTKDLCEDHFDIIFSTLYNEENKWIKNILFESSSELHINKGDGFLCNDREWLHGRKAQKYKISNQRLIRYVYN